MCLQTWFTYCKQGHVCPVCKQCCAHAVQLFFQQRSVEQNAVPPQQLVVSLSQLSSELDRVKKELLACKEKAQNETTLKVEALHQQQILQSELQMKSEELNKSSLDCCKLQETNNALTKELTALKLASSVQLDGNDIDKLNLGKEAKVDVLKKTVVLQARRNSDSFIKSRILERRAARLTRSLEQARETIAKLKARVGCLKTDAEGREKDFQKLEDECLVVLSKRQKC